MTLQPLLAASWAVQVHMVTLVLGLLVGTWQFLFSRKGAAAHRMLGAAFIALMVVMALVTLFIHARSPNSAFFGLSVLHLYVPLVLGLSGIAAYGGMKRRLALHRFAVIALYFGSLIFTGVVQTFLVPGITHDLFFSR
jgi:uncharacterized membrane protein